MTQLAATYADARAQFLAAAESSGAVIDSIAHPQSGRQGEPLAIDVADFGPPNATSALLVVSGTHGVEGFCGSALQTGLMTRLAASCTGDAATWLGGRRLVLVHGLNPVGFSWIRRVNEDNIDLNRNFIDWAQPPPVNGGYDALAELLVPETWTTAEQERTTSLLLEQAMAVGLEQMQADVSSGQYKHPEGLFYGGTAPAWSNQALGDTIMPRFRTLDELRVIDLHTGLGPWGVGELITSYRPGDSGLERASALWGSVTSMHDGSSTSAKLTGDWLDAIGGWLPGVEVTAAALEFGTVDAVTVLQALRADAWLHARGDPSSAEAEATRAQVRAAFTDDDPSWMETVNVRFTEVFEQAR